MGCDIHLTVERRVNGTWQNVNKFEDDGYGVEDEYYDGRNYDLFAILADVRNGRGFAGIKTGEGFVPISQPRGIPDDASGLTRQFSETWGVDGHSHSFFTVAELMAYDWTQTTHKEGVVDLVEWAHYKVNGSPSSWSGAVSGGRVNHLSIGEVEGAFAKLGNKQLVWSIYHGKQEALDAMARALGKETTPNGTDVVTTVRWKVAYYESARKFLYETMPKLWRLGKPEDVRIIFFFDN